MENEGEHVMYTALIDNVPWKENLVLDVQDIITILIFAQKRN